MARKNYPVSDIDEGIRRSLKISLEWLETGHMLLNLGNKNQAFIHYTFAVEEFGKAILLNDRKKEALYYGDTMVSDDKITFSNHDEKIKRAEEVLKDPMTKIRLIDVNQVQPLDLTKDIIEQIPQFTDVSKFPYKPDNFLSFDNRMSLMYADYDETTGKWKDVDELPLNSSMEVGFDAFKEEVVDWQGRFEKGLI